MPLVFFCIGAPSLANKYQTRVDLSDTDKHGILLRFWIVYDRKKFYAICGQCFTAVSYDFSW